MSIEKPNLNEKQKEIKDNKAGDFDKIEKKI